MTINNREKALGFLDVIFKLLNGQLEEAKKGVEKGKTITTIAQEVGYSAMLESLDEFNQYLRNNLK